MAKKQVIRLTEGDLHNIIKESVNKVLTELDWKTYANAYKKARETETPERYSRFKDAARDAFNKEYGYSDEDGSYKMDNGMFSIRDENGWGSFLNTHSFNVIKPNGTVINGDESFDLTPYPNTEFYGKSPAKETRYEIPKKTNAAYKAKEKGDREIDKYRKGNYEYIKGKGWVEK